MTIKKQYLIMMSVIALLAVVINSMLFGFFIDTFFIDYLEDRYQNQVEEIQEYLHYVLEDQEISLRQVEMEMQKYLDDPITGIILYRPDGQQILRVEGRPRGMMHDRMMGRQIAEARDEYDLIQNEQSVGKVIIIRRGSVADSATAMLFKNELWIKSVQAGAIVLLIALVGSILISRKTAGDLIHTADYAKSLDMEHEIRMDPSRIREIREIQESLTLLAAKSRLKEQTRKQKADLLAHQARTPLTILKSNLEGIRDGIVPPDQARLESCIQQVDNMTKLLNNVGDIIETRAEDPSLHKENIDLAREIQRIVRGFKTQFSGKEIALSLETPPSLSFTTDRDMLAQVLYSLLSNAYKFTPHGGQVRVALENTEVGPVILVQDSGIGIPKDQVEQIFQPYFRSSNVSGIQGQGLGLYVLKKNLDIMGANVQVESAEGQGTMFRIALGVDSA